VRRPAHFRAVGSCRGGGFRVGFRRLFWGRQGSSGPPTDPASLDAARPSRHRPRRGRVLPAGPRAVRGGGPRLSRTPPPGAFEGAIRSCRYRKRSVEPVW